ncbi:sigma-70 family RNA polymerase sigma factor [Acinetobacter rudis]|uniref:RNA polymerase sigma-70 factor, ECF subfamily n=1 Tax=Acinetobacter rudis CIP 110305 TaxID=421052 RepID=S3P9V7_9GAMM|nr:sigma-70 family RNA polymerase sigma factor [Acinetobacter rudis]EPF75636.1 hypothetical protein F945_01303 [Acinetobacter rudis CIP 110305]
MSEQIHQLYQGHHTWLYQWFKRRLNNSEDAADLAQDTFLRIMKRQEALHFEQPRAILTTVAKGILFNWYKRQEIEKAYLEALENRPEEYERSPEHVVEAVEALFLISELLDQFSDRERQIFLWSQLDGISQVEIAKRLNISTRTVMRDLTKVLSKCISIIE